jgi:hypothetical protein
MLRAKKLADEYAFQTNLIKHLINGVTDQESLMQLPFEANCMNWILGHILSRRHSAIEALGADPLWGEDQLSKYRTGSEPISKPDQALAFSTLQHDLERSMDMLQNALQNSSNEVLDRKVVNDRGEKSAYEHLEGFLWHETYHIGQLEILGAYIETSRQD